MKHERDENYEWALRHLRHLFGQKLPTAIVSDRELGLLQAAKRVFPEVKHLLCRVHVHRNVEAYANGKIKCDESRDHFTRGVQWLFRSATVEIYENRLARMWESWAGLMNYVQIVWLGPYKEHLVSAWTDTVLHFVTRSTNR